MSEYHRFFETDDKRPEFAGTKEQYEIGDNVELNGIEYKINNFYCSFHALPNQIDWIRLERHNGVFQIWADVYPSEIRLLSRPVE